MKKPLPQFFSAKQLLKPYKALVLVFCLVCVSAFAQAQTLKGKVFDSKTGEPLAGATVTAAHDGHAQYASTKLDGSFIFKNVTAGDYEVSVKYIGFAASKQQTAHVTASESSNLSFYLDELSTEMREVTVSSQGSKVSDRAARGLEKNAPTVENILSQNTIQLLPDVTLGNTIQRVSGVTVQRTSTGEGRYAIIRGMDQRYNNTLINGIKIPSPDDKYRFVPLDIFPSELLERLEVIKALTPSMEGDAIGGTMNLVMKSAPERFTLYANASGGFSTLFSSSRPFTAFSSDGLSAKSPSEIQGNNTVINYGSFNNSAITSNKRMSTPFNTTEGLTIGDRFLDNKLGVILSASHQNIYRGSNSTELTPNAQPNPVPANSPLFSDAYTRQYSTQTERTGVNAKADYVFNKQNRISLYGLYLRSDEYISRITADTLGLGLNSTAQSKQVTISDRNTYTKQNIYNATLQGEHQLADKIRFNWSGVYSLAKRDQPDRTDFSFDQNTLVNTQGAITQRDSNNMNLVHHWERNSDRDLAGYGNFTFTPNIANRVVQFDLGGMYRHKTRSTYYVDYKLSADGFYHGNINAVPFIFADQNSATGSYLTAIADNYNVTENINGEYLQVKFNLFDKLQVLGGVRVENTWQNYTTWAPVSLPGRSGTIAYTDVLPSVHLKYQLGETQNLRFSYYDAISRPGFGEIVPFYHDGEYYTEVGNPDLRHTTSNNYDLRYEWFPGGADQVLLGAFYKDITDPIEYFVVRDGASPSAQDIKPENAASGAKNYGAEVQVTKYFGVLGVSANYTYTHSRITTDKLLYYQDPVAGNQQKPVSQSRPLQGQADNVGNISLLFKSNKIGLDMQLAFVYTGERIAQVSPYYNLDYWQAPLSQLDFSFEKRLVKRLSVYGKVNNLTNAASKIYLKYPHASIQPNQQEFLGVQDVANQTLVQSDIYKISFLAGLRYKF